VKYFYSIILCLLSLGGWAQTPQQWESYGDKSVEDGDHYGASLYYKKSLVIDEENPALWLKYGYALKAYNDYEKAEEAFQAAWDKHLLPEQQIAQYWLAEMQMSNGRYRKAYVNFDEFYGSYINPSSFYVRKANQRAQACRWAMSNRSDSSDFEVKNIESGISTEHSEFSPYLMEDGSLLFTSLRFEGKSAGRELKKEEDDQRIWLYKAMWKDSGWTETLTMDTALNPNGLHFGNACPSPNSRRMYYSLCDDEFNCMIWKAELDERGNWYKVEPLNEMVNETGSSNSQPHAAMVKGREILFFTSDRLRGRGGMDIWYSAYNQTRKAFSRPKNMGKNVNTPGDEISPFWLSDSSHLYFSSDWHFGYGGFDIFMTKGVLNSLYQPVNMGLGINSPANDFYFKRFPKQEKAFLASNREGGISLKGQTCCNDIYLAKYIPPEPVKEVVKEEPKEVLITEEVLEEELEEVQDLLPLSLYFHNDQPNPHSWSTSTDLSYKEAFGDYLNLLDDYLSANRHIAKRHQADSLVSETQKFFEEQVKGGLEQLDHVMEMLKHQLSNGHHIELTIKGFASPLAKSEYNHNLTERRIASLINYIERYDKGWFLDYIKLEGEGGKLVLKEEPFGETQAGGHISDDHTDHRRSIYGLQAARERRIEIIRITETD
jgi:tetratricopeptide (TPR) repeat protein